MSLYEATLSAPRANSPSRSPTCVRFPISAPERSGAALESTSSDSSTAAAAQTELNLKPRLLDQVRDCMRRRHYSVRTEKVYVGCIRRFILFHDKRHPKDMGPDEVNAFLSHLAGREHVAASTQNQALSALLSLYRHILESPLPWLDDMERATRPARLPTVLTVREVQAVLAQMQGTRRLMAALLYGAGLRLLECLTLRVKDIAFERGQLIVRDAKGFRDRVTVLPDSLSDGLKAHLQRMKELHDSNLRIGLGRVSLPFALERKYPRAGLEWAWQFAFPSRRICTSPYTGHRVRYHCHPKTAACRRSGGSQRPALVMQQPGIGVHSPLDR